MRITALFTIALPVAGAILLASACGSENPAGPTPPIDTCSYTLSPASVQAPASGQTATVHVDTAPACAWTARSQSTWVSLSAASGAGPADIVISVAANDGAAERTATVTIADRDLSVRQSGRTAASCSFALSSPSSTFGANGGRGTIAVQTDAGCAWTASAAASWVTLRTSAGTGPGEIEYDVASYTGTTQRETRISVGDAFFQVRQDPPAPAACTYAVDPTSTKMHWHGSSAEGLAVRLDTLPHCAWTAASDTAWIELLTPASGSGAATIQVHVAAYTLEPTRSAPLMVRWPTDTAGQNVWITQEGCRYATSLTNDMVPASGGRRRVSVFGDPVSVDCAIGCPWTVASNATWIHPVGAVSRAGDDDVFFDVDPNTSGATRTGTLTVAGRTLTVIQGG